MDELDDGFEVFHAFGIHADDFAHAPGRLGQKKGFPVFAAGDFEPFFDYLFCGIKLGGADFACEFGKSFVLEPFCEVCGEVLERFCDFLVFVFWVEVVEAGNVGFVEDAIGRDVNDVAVASEKQVGEVMGVGGFSCEGVSNAH